MIPKLNVDFPVSRVFKSFYPWIKSERYDVGDGNRFYVNHARTGLRIALSALNLPKGSRVGVSMYNCYTVMNSVKAAGLEIEFLELTDNLLLDVDFLKNKKSILSAVIVTHFYGIANDVDMIRQVLPDIPIIEDCAHSYGASFNDGVEIGAKGDFAVFSVGLGKFPSIGDGGILCVNNNRYRQRVEAACEKLPSLSFRKELSMILKSHLLYLAYRPFVYGLLLPLKKRQQKKGTNRGIYRHFEAKMPKYVRYLFEKDKNKLETLKNKQLACHRRISLEIGEIKGVYLPKYDYNRGNGFLFPIIVEDVMFLENCNYIKHYEKTSHFSKSIDWASEFGYKNNCPNSEKISKKTVILPCNYKLL